MEILHEKEMKRSNKVIDLIDKAVKQKANNKINYDYWENLLAEITDTREMTIAEAYAIDKIIGLNLY